ncbi:hypothetical protein GQ600_18173 [Phytophthora cactorum]|nr:hypothetical protein GQ600_18173 [Phytophthora cactorum]
MKRCYILAVLAVAFLAIGEAVRPFGYRNRKLAENRSQSGIRKDFWFSQYQHRVLAEEARRLSKVGITRYQDFWPVPNLKAFAVSDRDVCCCNAFVADCNLGYHKYGVVHPVWKSHAVGNTQTAGVLEGPPPEELMTPCNGTMCRQYPRDDNVEVRCYYARFMGTICTANPYLIEMRLRLHCSRSKKSKLARLQLSTCKTMVQHRSHTPIATITESTTYESLYPQFCGYYKLVPIQRDQLGNKYSQGRKNIRASVSSQLGQLPSVTLVAYE